MDRKMPIGADAPAPKDKEVLAFYFMVNNEQTAGVKNYDNSKIIWANPQNPQWGTGSHYWGEPYFGYYASNDEWVIRRHAKMLTQAGVDAIVLDVTNHTTYDDVINAIFNTFAKMRQEGNDTPQISFMLPNSPAETANSAEYLYKTIYGLGRYKDLWYNFKGKPLLLGDSSSLTGELLDFFTWRKCWAWSAGKDQWSWVAHVPQPYGYHESAGTPEQVSVAMAQHATTNIGRSYSNGRQPDYKEPFGVDITTSGEGIYYKEQWDSALSMDPELVFITGFNEWVAGLYRTNADGTEGEDFLGVPKSPNSVYFVDNATPEYSRDFEPMRGFFYDNYYYQTVQNIRKYKGTRRQFDVGEKKTIDLAGDFSQWDDVCPEYRDSVGDTWHREAYGNHSNNFTENYYENTTGRNDIEAAKVARDDENMYFYVRCTQPITRPMDNWMVLYLNTDRLYKNGWQGYDFVVNHKLGTLEKFTGGWNFETVGEVDYVVNGREMMLVIPRQSLGLAAGEDITIDFKWADNSQNDGTVYDFMTLGDVAPDMRFNYRYTEDKAMVEKQVITDGAFDRGAKAAVTVENPLLTDMVVMQLGVAGGFVKNTFTPIDVVPAVVNDRTMVPLRFISEAFGAQVDWDGDTQTATVTSGVYDKITVQFTIGSDTMLVNGAAKTIDAPPVLQDDRTLLPIRALSEALGKNVLWDNDTRIIIIGSKEQDFDALAQNRGLLDYINLKFETVK